jgi:hypothetical protein
MLVMTRDQMHELVDATQGTCKSLEEVCEDHFGHEPMDYDNEMEICQFVDNLIFNCVVCGWWFEMGDMAQYCDEWTCSSCEDGE